MNQMKQLTLLLLLVASLQVNAQEAVLAAGGEATGSGGTASYSIGQMMYATTGSNGSVSEGVQQPYEIVTILGVDVEGIHLNMAAYPNPTSGTLTLKIEDTKFSTQESTNLRFTLYDAQGKSIESKEHINKTSFLKMENLQEGLYYLKVANEKEVIKTFKIIKK